LGADSKLSSIAMSPSRASKLFSRTIAGIVLLSFATRMRAAPAETARVFLEEGRLRTSGVTLAGAPETVRFIAGPRPELAGMTAVGTPVSVSGRLERSLPERGSLQFWFRTDRAYRSGSKAAKFTEKLVDVAGTVSVAFVAEANALTLMVQWQGRKEVVAERHIRVILPQFPGPAWHHVAVNWDGPAGVVNAFLDGTPYNLPEGPREPSFAVGTATGVALHLGRFALADVRMEAAPVSEKELRASVGSAHWGALDTLLGVRDYGPAPAPAERGELLYARALGAADDARGWRLEGPGIVEYRDGWMQMKSERPDGPDGHLVHWCPEEFPERFWAERSEERRVGKECRSRWSPYH
jgi:hypothetical protein